MNRVHLFSTRAYPSALLLLSSLTTLAAGCGPPPGDAPSAATGAGSSSLLDEGTPAYRDVEEVWSNEDDQNRWFDLKQGLARDFDEICGDTFCEGEFTNLQPMGFRCSVSGRTGQIKSCLWLFAGSYETVTASTGNVRPTGRFFSCAFPVAGTARELLDALLATEGRGPLWRALPGTATSIYDLLGDCL